MLFADLSGFTAAAERMDPEEVHAFLEPLMEHLRSIVEMYGGTILNTMGDGFLAVFGAPVAHRDDAALGVRAALAGRDAVRSWSQRGGLSGIDFHAGVHTGWVFVAPTASGFDIVGDTVNTASRLASAAGAGTILVGEMTRTLSAGAIRFASLDPVAVKGKAAPLEVCEAVEAIPESPERFLRPRKTPFVGRAAERRTLDEAFRAVTGDERAQTVIVAGPPGIGKSRLVAEFVRPLDARVLVGRAIPYGDRMPWYAIASALRTLPELASVEESPSARTLLRTFVDGVLPDAGDDDREHVAHGLGLVLGFTPGLSPNHPAGRGLGLEIAAALRRFLAALAQQRPLVVVLEDLQWTDPEVAAFLRQIREDPPTGRFMLLGLVWDEALAAVGLEPDVSVGTIGERDGLDLVDALLPHAHVPDSVATALWARSEGNPLFLEEILKLLQDRGTLRAEGGRWALMETTRPEVPENVYLVVAARIDELPAEERRLLRDAAVCGPSFGRGVIAALGWGTEADPLLASLVERGLLYLSGDTDGFAFGHPVIRDVAYDGMPRMDRAQKHLSIADWIRAGAEGAAEPVETLAYHYGRAAAIGLFEASADVSPLATEYLSKAGDRALAQGAVREAESWYRQALELTPQSVERAKRDGRAALHPLLRHARALFELGRYDTARAQATLAFEVGRAVDDDAAQGEALLQVATLDSLFGAVQDARRLFGIARDMFGEAGDAVGIARVVQGLAETWRLTDTRQVIDKWGEAAELFGQAGDVASQSRVVRDIAYGLTPKGGSEFDRWFRESERLTELVGDRRSRIALERTRGFRSFYVGDWAAAVEPLQRALTMARDSGDVFVEVDAAFVLARIALAEGDRTRAAELGAGLLRLGRGLGLRRTEEEGLVVQALVAAREGRLDDAADHLQQARAALETIHADYEMVEVEHAEAVVALDAGRWEAALAGANELRVKLERFGDDLDGIRATLIAGRARLGAGAYREAADLFDEALRSEGSLPDIAALAGNARAEALAALGDGDGARSSLADPNDAFPEQSALFNEASAVIASREGDAEAAGAAMVRAIGAWQRLGRTVWAERAQDMLATIRAGKQLIT